MQKPMRPLGLEKAIAPGKPMNMPRYALYVNEAVLAAWCRTQLPEGADVRIEKGQLHISVPVEGQKLLLAHGEYQGHGLPIDAAANLVLVIETFSEAGMEVEEE